MDRSSPPLPGAGASASTSPHPDVASDPGGQLRAFLAGYFANAEGRVLVASEAADAIVPASVLHAALARRVVSFVKPGPDTPHLCATRQLPFPDGSFELTVLDSLSAHVAPTERIAVLKEAWRVTRGVVIHLEPAGTTPETLAPAWEAVTPLPLEPLSLMLPGCALLQVARARAAAPRSDAVAHLEAELKQERVRLAQTRSALSAAEREAEEASEQLEALEQSPARRIARGVLGLPMVGKPTERTLRYADTAVKELQRRGWLPPRDLELPSPEPSHRLDFDGIATRASLPDPEDFLEARPRVVAMCHPEWRGIRAATYGQGVPVIEVPAIVSDTHARRLALFLKDCGTERLVMNGCPKGTERLAAALAEVVPELEFFIVFHGSMAALQEDKVLARMLDLSERGLVHKLGFVKQGMAEYFRQRGATAEFVMNICRMEHCPPSQSRDGHAHVGVFAPNVPHKNVESQLVAALMVPGTIVHTLENVHAEYLHAEHHRFVEHGMMPRDRFLELLRQMQATCYVSLVEAYPMTVMESLYAGAVCVTSHTSMLFDDAPELFESLVVQRHDNPAAIARKLSAALEARGELVPRAQAYLDQLNDRAEKRWREFLDE